MSRRFFLLFAGLCYVMIGHCAVSVKAVIEPVKILIGEQATLTLTVTTDSPNKAVIFPAIETLNKQMPLIEFMRKNVNDTLKQDGSVHQHICQYVLTSFEDSLYYIEPLTVAIAGKEYKGNELSLKVETVAVDTTNTAGYGPKDVFDVYANWDDSKNTWCITLLLLISCVLFAGYELRFIQRKPIVSIKKEQKQKLSPHEWAQKKLGEMGANSKLDVKTFYTALTDILRTYMQRRYHFSANEMTSTEIIKELVQRKDDKMLDELRRLFTTADLVKFAKQDVSQDERNKGVSIVEDYIRISTPIETEQVLSIQKEDNLIHHSTKEKKFNYLISVVYLCITIYWVYLVVDYLLIQFQ